MDTNDKQQQQKDQKGNSTGLRKTENNKRTGAEGEQHAVGNKLREDIYIIWHKVRLLQTYKREMLPKLKENSKLIKLKEEINGMLYAFFWVIPRLLNFIYQGFGTLCLFNLHRLCRHTTYDDGKDRVFRNMGT